jgi:uncharacterized MAPEG superfamily protein
MGHTSQVYAARWCDSSLVTVGQWGVYGYGAVLLLLAPMAYAPFFLLGLAASLVLYPLLPLVGLVPADVVMVVSLVALALLLLKVLASIKLAVVLGTVTQSDLVHRWNKTVRDTLARTEGSLRTAKERMDTAMQNGEDVDYQMISHLAHGARGSLSSVEVNLNRVRVLDLLVQNGLPPDALLETDKALEEFVQTLDKYYREVYG